MTENEAIKRIKECRNTPNFQPYVYMNEALNMAIKALEKQEKIKEIIENANLWSKKDIVVKAQAFCDIEKILRRDEE